MKIFKLKTAKIHFGLFHKVGRDPYTDWFIILTLSFIVAILFVWSGVSLFLKINDNAGAPTYNANAVSLDGMLNKTDLAKLVAVFEDKKAKTALFLSGYQGVPDPSLIVATSSHK